MAERSSRRESRPEGARPGHGSERSGRSGSTRPTGILLAQQALANAEEANEEMLKDRLEKIQQVMNQAAMAGLDVDPKHLEEHKNILADIRKMKAERSKTLREEFQARRAASAPVSARGSQRLQQDLQAGVNPRAAKRAEKSRQRAEHRRKTSKERVTDWKAFERTRPEDAYEATANWDRDDKGDYPEEPRKRNLVPEKHRGGRERSEKKRKKLQQERLTIQEEEDLIAMQMAELNETQGVRLQLCSGTLILRNTDLSQVQVEAKGQINLQVSLKVQTTKRSNLTLPWTGWRSNSVRILKYHPR